MTCYYPIDGWRAKKVNENGKREIVFNVKDGFSDMPVSVPCGNCIGCRLEHSRQWAIRCVHEAAFYDDNSFLTVTYNTENLPETGSLVLEDLQKFLKRLRKSLAPQKIRYFACGEYGQKCKHCGKHITTCECGNYQATFGRPHYHLIVFNYWPDDLVHFTTKNGNPLYTSERLNKIWGKGFVIVGNVTFESAAYVARYVLKKIRQRDDEIDEDDGTTHYEKVTADGEIQLLKKEFITMSRRPGIGRNWYEKFKAEVFPNDLIVVRGKKMRPPKYYQSIYEEENVDEYIDIVKKTRKKEALKHKEHSKLDRLRVRETVKLAQITSLKRNQEDEIS